MRIKLTTSYDKLPTMDTPEAVRFEDTHTRYRINIYKCGEITHLYEFLKTK